MKIGVDLDDNSFDFVGAYLLFHNETYKTNLKKEDFRIYSFNGNRIRKFYNTSFFSEIKPFPGAAEVLQKLKENNELIVVTSRPITIKEKTFEQIYRHFPNTFSEVFFSSNHYTKAKNSGKTKAEICLEKNVSLMIEDSLVYSKQCVEKGIKAILLDSFWNQNGDLEGITRVKDWKEIGGLLI